MPHGRNVKATADLNAPGHMGQMDGVQQEIGDALIALRLEMVLGHPEAVIAQPIQRGSNRLGLRKHLDEFFIGEGPVVDGRPGVPHVVHIDMPSKTAVKM